MADQIQTPGSGGGEGVAAAVPSSEPPALEAKSVELPKSVVPADVKTEELKIVKPEVEAKPETPQDVKPEEFTEVKPEQPTVEQSEQKEEVKQEVAPVSENKVEAPLAESKETAEVKTEANEALNKLTHELGDWQQKESDLLKTIEDLENVKKERTKESLLLELKVREEEIDLLKARVKNLETELQAALSKPSGKNHEMIENIKLQHEELLSKARGMIFDKTKMVKNQELQIEALTTQIQSLKDINQITKDLLEIRNSEIKAMEDRLQAMEARFKAEKERYGLVLQRAQTSSNINDDLRKEYETQLVLFKQLREKYDQRVQALVAENERLKGSAAPGGGAGASG